MAKLAISSDKNFLPYDIGLKFIVSCIRIHINAGSDQVETSDYNSDKQVDDCLLSYILKISKSLSDGSSVSAESLCIALLLQFHLMDQSKCMFGALVDGNGLFFPSDEYAEICTLTSLICNVHNKGTIQSVYVQRSKELGG